jgi:hypothetical protein
MYCATRSSITCQAEITTMMVMKAVSGTNHSDRPSMPRKYWMLKRSTHDAFSANWTPWKALSNPVNSGIVGRKLTAAPTSDNTRVNPLLWSRPTAMIRMPNRIGSQTDRLRYGKLEEIDCILFFSLI